MEHFQLGEKRFVPAPIYAFVLHDWQLAKYDYKPRSLFDPNDGLLDTVGYPEMVNLTPRPGIRLTEQLQWFMVKQLVLSKYNKNVNNKQEFFGRLSSEEREYIVRAFCGLTKSQTAFTNNAGTEEESGRRNYIAGWNTGGEFPILFENTCGGTTVELFSNIKYANGYKIKTLRNSDYEIWKNRTYKSHPQYFTKAVNATVIPYQGKWRIDAMHYLDGKEVAIPIISETGYSFIATDRVILLNWNNSIPSPYYPYP